MAKDFSVEPFFDDYSEDKKFHRILFRPGFAVQARELTQLQTILQEQIRRHGDHIFKEGSMVIPGQISYDLDVSYVHIAVDAGVNIQPIFEQLVGKEISNAAGLKAKVISFSLEEKNRFNEIEPNTIYVKYLNSVQDNAGNNVSVFNPFDLLIPTDGSSGLSLTVADATNQLLIPPVGKSASATVQRGVYYIAKNFVLVQEQLIILDKYDNASSCRVGLQLIEDIVLPDDDESLLDNALGSPNFAAPGAARYFIDLKLVKVNLDGIVDVQSIVEGQTYVISEVGTTDFVPLGAEANEVGVTFVAKTTGAVGNGKVIFTPNDSQFIELMRLSEGKVLFKLDRTQYAEIEKTLARRTYDESGDYTVSPFNLQIKEYRNNLRGDWAAGEKFIQGDLIKVPTSATAFTYFVCVQDGISGTTKPAFQNFLSVDKFIENNGSPVWEQVEYPNFNGGVYTFPAGSSLYSAFTLNDHHFLDNLLALAVEPGKAYVRGREIEKIATEYLPIRKSRDFPQGSDSLVSYFGSGERDVSADNSSVSGKKSFDIDVSLGSYVIVQSSLYAPDITTFATIDLHSAAYASAAANTIIGKARIRAYERHDVAGQFKVFLFDIKMNAGREFKDVVSLRNVNNANSFRANIVRVGTPAITVLNEPANSDPVYRLPDYAIKTIISADYSVVTALNGTSNASGVLSLTAPSTTTFASPNDADNYIVIKNSDGSIVNVTPVRTNSTTLTISGLAINTAHTVIATLEKSNTTTGFNAFTTTDAFLEFKTQAEAQVRVILFPNGYVTRIVSVFMSTNPFNTASPVYSVNITNRYNFDAAQYGSYIGQPKLTLAPGAAVPTGPIRVKYEYLATNTTTGQSNFFAINSYLAPNSGIRYDQVGSAESYQLRDCIDFRPIWSGTGFAGKFVPKFGSIASFEYTHYLPRIDNISLSASGNFIVSRGIPSLLQDEPNTPNQSMKIARLSLEPYTFKRDDSHGVAIDRIENKRYTMRDIGKLERRISDLEYYTALTLTELETKNMRIVDGAGFDRFQNGFLVDNFEGQGVGNAASEDWNCSIDTQQKELRPFFSQKQVSLLENSAATNKQYKVSGDLVTLPFSETDMVIQLKASKTENVNPYDLFTFFGTVEINPWSDTWFSTHYRPDIILNDEKQYNAIVAKANADGILGTVWNNWQTMFSSTRSLGTRLQNLGAWATADTQILNASNNGGSFWRNRATFTAEELEFIGGTAGNLNTGVAGSRVLTIETQAVETQASRTGTRSFIVDKIDSRVLEDRVVETRVVPFIRPRAVLFTGFAFKPSTRLYGFFDNILVDDYITPATQLEVTPISGYSNLFDVTRNAGSNVSQPERTVWYNDGTLLSGTVYITNGSRILNGVATSFLGQVSVGDVINLGGNLRYTVESIQSNSQLTFKASEPAYSGPTIPELEAISAKVIGPKWTTAEVEVAFNHGEVIKEFVNGVATGNTAIVVAQEVVDGKFFIYVLNIKGSGQFSNAATAEFRGEYTTTANVLGSRVTSIPRVKFVNRTDFTALTSSGTGIVAGIFRIPSSPLLKFRTGTRELLFSDSPANSPAVRVSQQSTSGGAIYQAQGLIEINQRTIVATRTAQIVSEQVSQNNTIVTTTDRLTRDTGWYDPLAQTFLVQQEGGAFLTSVDVFFKTADPKVPVRLEIREVVNGYPGATILPFSKVEKKGADVLLSDDGSRATTFKFTSPVFVQNGTEYAIVLLSDSNRYNVFISQTDTIDILSGNRILSQPYAGVLFKSQNGSTWTADQTQDLKFVIRRAKFITSPVTLELIPPPLGYVNLPFNPFNFIAGSRKCRVNHPNHGMVVGEVVRFKSRQVIESINGISASEIFDKDLTILQAELDSYVIEFGGSVNSNAAGQVGGGFITATENYEFSTAMIEVGQVVPAGTSISYVAKVINHDDEISQHNLIVKENFNFDEPKVYPSFNNYVSNTFPSGLSILCTLNPAALDSVSPVIDLGRIAMTMVSNKVDSPTVLTATDPTLDVFPITAPGQSTTIGSGQPIDLIDIDNDGIEETIVINSIAQPTLYNNFNNNLNVGDVIRFTYSDITNAIRYMVIVEKSQDDVGNLYLTLEGAFGETIMETSGNNVQLAWMSHFKDEYAASGGSTHSKYVTKKINFSRPSEMLRIMMAAVIPTDAEVEVYYKTGLGVDGDFIASRYFKATPKFAPKKSDSEFTDLEFDVEDLEPFDSIIVKIVMKSINTAKVPRIKDFRVIACAA